MYKLVPHLPKFLYAFHRFGIVRLAFLPQALQQLDATL